MDSTKTSEYRFGPFEFSGETGELRKSGTRIALPPKAQQLLAILLERRGEIVRREELHKRLWSDGTFVDFESGLNTTANRLRIKLQDSAANPRYIETLPRVGYRFIGSLEPAARGESEDEAGAAGMGEGSAVGRRRILPWVAALAGLPAAALGWRLGARSARSGEVDFRVLTFRRGQVTGARYAQRGAAVVYSAAWEGGPQQLYLLNGEGPESRAMGFAEHSLASLSPRDELALLKFGGTMNIAGGVLHRVAASGSAAEYVARGVMSADWTGDGGGLVAVRAANGENHLEAPLGKAVHRTHGWLSSPRVEPGGGRVAFLEHPFRHGENGRVMVYEPGVGVRVLSDGWASVSGLAWHGPTREVWFTGARDSRPRSVWAVTLAGTLRAVAQAPGVLTLRDIAPDGRALVTRDTRRLEMAGRLAGFREERDLSWLDWSRVQELSADGTLLLFEESGEAAGNRSIVYVRDNRGGVVARLGEGVAMCLAPDGLTALVGREDRERLALVPCAGGAYRWLKQVGLRYQWARILPDGKSLLALAARPGKGLRLVRHELDGGEVRELSGEMMIRNLAIAPDGETVAVLAPGGELMLYPLQRAAPPVHIPTPEPLAPLLWSADGSSMAVQHLSRAMDASARLSWLRVAGGGLQPWKTLRPADPVGVNSITGVVLSRDGSQYVYSYRRVLSELFAASGWG
ncbi:MAG: winged helix-turn-helix domain-containing protein [Acidobacteria bacterium]|nr:winged helix-turn-helix domain-containing protein [Acidobacteriota bacterium]